MKVAAGTFVLRDGTRRTFRRMEDRKAVSRGHLGGPIMQSIAFCLGGTAIGREATKGFSALESVEVLAGCNSMAFDTFRRATPSRQ
jgi:hypothetical protein